MKVLKVGKVNRKRMKIDKIETNLTIIGLSRAIKMMKCWVLYEPDEVQMCLVLCNSINL